MLEKGKATMRKEGTAAGHESDDLADGHESADLADGHESADLVAGHESADLVAGHESADLAQPHMMLVKSVCPAQQHILACLAGGCWHTGLEL